MEAQIFRVDWVFQGLVVKTPNPERFRVYGLGVRALGVRVREPP